MRNRWSLVLLLAVVLILGGLFSLSIVVPNPVQVQPAIAHAQTQDFSGWYAVDHTVFYAGWHEVTIDYRYEMESNGNYVIEFTTYPQWHLSTTSMILKSGDTGQVILTAPEWANVDTTFKVTVNATDVSVW